MVEIIKSEEEIKRERRRKHLNENMKSCDWYCDVCKNGGKNYALRGKFTHLNTKKHQRNYYKDKPLIIL